jgi:hypothetical protein
MQTVATLGFGLLCTAGGLYCLFQAFRQYRGPYLRPPSALARIGWALLASIGMIVGISILLPLVM